jgi:hypothetical protein
MVKWFTLFLWFTFVQVSAQYSYTYTDPCTLQHKSVFVPAGGGVVVNYFDNHNTFSANDFSSGIFDAWIAQVSQQNSNSPCQSVTTTLTNNVTSTVVSNTVGIVTNVVAISSLAQSMASISSSIGSSMSATASGISNTGIGNSVDNNQSNSNDKSNSSTSTGSNTGTSGTGSTGNSSQTSQTPSSTSGGTSSQPSTGAPQQGGSTTSPNQSTSTGDSTSESSVGGSGNTANSVSNSIDGGSSEGGSSSGGGGGSSSSSSKKQAAAKTSSGSLIASGDMVAISSTDGTTANQYKIVGSITHANTRGTRIKGILFNYTTGANNVNVTLYKSWINKSRSLNTIAANSTMMDFEKNIFNTTTGLESYKVNKTLTGMFGLNFTLGKMGERSFYNLSSVGGGHVSTKVTDRVSTSFLVLAIYSPFTQFYDGKWFGAGVLFVPFNSWDFKITKTFKYNISFTGVYQMNESFLNYQVLTGGKISF